MARPKKTSRPQTLLSVLANFLIGVGTPPFFFLKILFWTAVWLLSEGSKIAGGVVGLLWGLGATLGWFGQIIVSPFRQIHLAFPHRPRLRATAPRTVTVTWKPYHPAVRKLFYFLSGALAFYVFVFVPYWTINFLSALPDPKLLSLRDIPVSTKIYDRNGILLYQIYDDQNRTIVNLSDLPPYLIDATIAIEDKNFYHHPGFDLSGMIRAAFANAGGQPVQGGSTITQQLVKSALLTPERTIIRKIKEAILAFWAERIYSKDQILTMYLNQIPYGGAAYGIEAAAQTYFNKPAKNLDLAQSALLAGLPSAPSVYSPFGTHPELTRERQHQVLTLMAQQGYISFSQAAAAENESLTFASNGTIIKAPHFVMYVKDLLAQKYGLHAVERGGLEVTTSLDYPTYEAVAQMVRDGVARQKDLNVGNGAALVTNPATGEILAMVGSTDYFDLAHDGNVNVTLARRSPGSSIKPLNYALAFEKNLLTPASILDDSPIIYQIPGSPPYIPQNYDNHFHGKVSARVALASSYNIPAIKVLEKNGLANFIAFARKMGITTFTDTNRFGLSLTLGGGEVTMIDMATAYSAFADNGLRTDLKPILEVKDYQGRILEDNRSPATSVKNQVISPNTAFLISNILSDDSARAPTFGAGSILNIPNHTVAVKTGTTQDKRDNWTIGYTPSYVVAVWVGNNDNSPMSPYLESGNTGAAAIWNPIMTYLLTNKPNEDFARPDNIVAVPVCALTSTLPCDNCPYVRTELFIRGTEPKTACKLTPEDARKLLSPEAH